jgi:hypothetical protein
LGGAIDVIAAFELLEAESFAAIAPGKIISSPGHRTCICDPPTVARRRDMMPDSPSNGVPEMRAPANAAIRCRDLLCNVAGIVVEFDS